MKNKNKNIEIPFSEFEKDFIYEKYFKGLTLKEIAVQCNYEFYSHAEIRVEKDIIDIMLEILSIR